MDIWIIKDGEKSGPIRDFEVRQKIHTGELTADTPTWHVGMSAWRPLSEIELFAREFDVPALDADDHRVTSLNDKEPRPEIPPPLPAQPHLIRRFWARWFDLYLFSGFWWLGMWAAGRDIEATLTNPWVILFQYIPWFALETILIHRWGTTPGKWLLGIHVLNDDRSLLDLKQATLRSSRVLFLGIGFGWGILALICQIMSYFTTRRLGRPLWDHAGGHRLQTAPLNPLRIVVYVVGLFAALQLQMIVVAPYVMEHMKKKFPASSDYFDENAPWHLPENR